MLTGDRMGSAWVWLNLRAGLLEVVAVLFALATLPPSLVESVVLKLAPLSMARSGNTETSAIRMALK